MLVYQRVQSYHSKASTWRIIPIVTGVLSICSFTHIMYIYIWQNSRLTNQGFELGCCDIEVGCNM